MSVRQLVRRAPQASARSWCPRQTPKSGLRPISPRSVSIVCGRSVGSPGPGEMKIASGSPREQRRLRVASYGSTVTRAPSAASSRKIARLTPQSISVDARAAVRAFDDERLARRDARNERLRVRPCARTPRAAASARCERLFADGERRPDRAVLAQRDGDRARVRADQCRNALFVEPRSAGPARERWCDGWCAICLITAPGDAGAPVLRRARRRCRSCRSSDR